MATVALIAADKISNEFLKNNRSANNNPTAKSSSMNSLEQLSLLAIAQYERQFSANRYSNPVAKISSLLSSEAVRVDPRGASLAALELLAASTEENQKLASATAQELLEIRTSNSAWSPSGNADSVSTALALQVLAATGAVSANNPAVRGEVEYLKTAQANDSAIAASTRIASAGGSSSVPATAFTAQALNALELAPPRTSTSKTVRNRSHNISSAPAVASRRASRSTAQ